MDLQQVIYTHIPGKNKQSSGGWTSFNCPCCVEEGEPRLDTRMRGVFEVTATPYHTTVLTVDSLQVIETAEYLTRSF